jgi:hypothetical protein
LLRAKVELDFATEALCDDCGSLGDVTEKSPTDAAGAGFCPLDGVCPNFRSLVSAFNDAGEDTFDFESEVDAALDALFSALDFSMDAVGFAGFSMGTIDLPGTELVATSGNFGFCGELADTA